MCQEADAPEPHYIYSKIQTNPPSLIKHVCVCVCVCVCVRPGLRPCVTCVSVLARHLPASARPHAHASRKRKGKRERAREAAHPTVLILSLLFLLLLLFRLLLSFSYPFTYSRQALRFSYSSPHLRPLFRARYFDLLSASLQPPPHVLRESGRRSAHCRLPRDRNDDTKLTATRLRERERKRKGERAGGRGGGGREGGREEGRKGEGVRGMLI